MLSIFVEFIHSGAIRGESKRKNADSLLSCGLFVCEAFCCERLR